MSQQAIADRLKQAGMEVSRQTIDRWLDGIAQISEPGKTSNAAPVRHTRAPKVATKAQLAAVASLEHQEQAAGMKYAAMVLFLLLASCASSQDPQEPSLGKAMKDAASDMLMQCGVSAVFGYGC